MDFFASAKGCVYVPNAVAGAGFYSLDGLGGGANSSPIMILNGGVNDTDIVLPVSTLNNKKVLYTFGRSFGNVTVNGMILLGPNGKSATLGSLLGWYQSNRTSGGGGTVNFSFPGGAYKLYVVGLVISEADPQFNIQYFQVAGLIASPK